MRRLFVVQGCSLSPNQLLDWGPSHYPWAAKPVDMSLLRQVAFREMEFSILVEDAGSRASSTVARLHISILDASQGIVAWHLRCPPVLLEGSAHNKRDSYTQ